MASEVEKGTFRCCKYRNIEQKLKFPIQKIFPSSKEQFAKKAIQIIPCNLNRSVSKTHCIKLLHILLLLQTATTQAVVYSSDEIHSWSPLCTLVPREFVKLQQNTVLLFNVNINIRRNKREDKWFLRSIHQQMGRLFSASALLKRRRVWSDKETDIRDIFTEENYWQTCDKQTFARVRSSDIKVQEKCSLRCSLSRMLVQIPPCVWFICIGKGCPKCLFVYCFIFKKIH